MSNWVKLYTIYDTYNCRVGEHYDQNCIQAIPNSETESILSELNYATSEFSKLTQTVSATIKQISYSINNVLSDNAAQSSEERNVYEE